MHDMNHWVNVKYKILLCFGIFLSEKIFSSKSCWQWICLHQIQQCCATFVFVSKIYDSYKHALGEATIHLNVDIHESAGDLSPNEVDVQIQEDHIENGEDENYEGVSGKSSKY